jgi:hypothetical protein
MRGLPHHRTAVHRSRGPLLGVPPPALALSVTRAVSEPGHVSRELRRNVERNGRYLPPPIDTAHRFCLPAPGSTDRYCLDRLQVSLCPWVVLVVKVNTLLLIL